MDPQDFNEKLFTLIGLARELPSVVSTAGYEEFVIERTKAIRRELYDAYQAAYASKASIGCRTTEIKDDPPQ